MIKLKSLLKESLLNELEFGTQKAFDSYQKQHDMRGDTEVTVAGKKMSVKQAVKQSGDKALKGSPVFGNNKGGEVFGKKSNTAKTDWNDDDSVRKLDSKVQSTLNKVIGSNGGYTNVNSAGYIEYNLETKNGADPIYTLFIGEDEIKKGKIRVTIEPSDNTNDPEKLSGKVDKSFNNEDDAIKFAGELGKKYRKQLEMGNEN